MSGDLNSTFVCRFNRGLQFGAGNVHVRFERGHAEVGPIVDHLARLVRTGQLMHLDEIAVGAFEIWPGHVDMRTGELAFIDVVLQVEISVGLDASRGAHGGHATGQIEAWRGECHLRNQYRRFGIPLAVFIWPRDVEKMVVHADDSGHYRIPAKAENRCSFRRGSVCTRLHHCDFAPFDDHVLVVNWRLTRAVNYAHVLENHSRRVHSHVFLHRCGQGGGLLSTDVKGQKQEHWQDQQAVDAHSVSSESANCSRDEYSSANKARPEP